MSSRTGSWSIRRRSRTASGSSPRTDHPEGTPTATTTDLTAVALRLRAILDPYREHLVEGEIYHMPVLRRRGASKHDWFAGVQPVEGAVKFNLLPMHHHPELLEGLPPELKRRKSGASVFRFTEIDEHLAGELAELVGRAFLVYMGRG